MATYDEVLKLRREIAGLRLLIKLTYKHTQPTMHWLASAVTAAVIVIPAIIIGVRQMPAEAQSAIDNGLNWVSNHVVIIGRAWADYTNNIDRSYTLRSGDLAIIGLSDVQACRWRYAMRLAESSGRYDNPGNTYGYFAGYGMGAEALSIVGLVKRSEFAKAPYKVRMGHDQVEWLDNPNNWTLSGGKQEFLRNPRLQDVAVSALANENIKHGFDAHILSQTQPEQIAGFAAATHLKGYTPAVSWYLRAEDSHDANGTNASDYAALGEASISQKVAECGDSGDISTPGLFSRLLGFKG